ncbi:L-2-hydroxyglutarate oxidase [Maridesulfovibrio hydrothermalis]|uniref:FAD dependent oxidoreductase n=1 Tax=Maridesulfovibrio hydrothermalis AM13 = DSM 14728 TaxID=1121451 RepID=L0RBE6_9BACT|nr:L-2-hydroxyglutarate oxidase [Maridesulfovibrio hydrothermalis]CCO24079.1 FAD dependent oxidoreductase [Maridesulfovibrio hydrothermalis AM13 = DSM 14728]
MKTAEILICGAGIVGLTVARELISRGYKDITIIDKEDEIARHASGRNSGVLHAGIYYAPGSLRAVSCLSGNFKMKEYCKDKGLPLLETGKVIVARNESELPTLHELHSRATANGAKVEIIDEQQLFEIEPNAKTTKQALFSHYTAVVDPRAVMNSLYNDLALSGKVTFMLGTSFITAKKNNVIVTDKGEISCGLFINAAGAYSDKVARPFGFGEGYQLIPFKGIYKKLKKEKAHTIKGSIYPVPNIKNPFLGIHFTRSATGDVYLGPTAIPAFGRENYGILKGLDKEAFDIILRDAILFLTNPKFRSIAFEEPRKYLFSCFFNDAKELVKDLSPDDIESTPKVGIRPQLVDTKRNELVMDFLVESDEKSVHVLNAISPAFTSSMYFAEMIVEKYIR